MSPRKILIIRFSSIGDIVLTTPVIRCLRQQLPQAEIHFVTKQQFACLLSENPYLHKIHVFKKEVAELFGTLKAEKFDLVIDLHRNLRSLRLKRELGIPAWSFDKINLRKFLAVRFKMLGLLPQKHIVERYMDTVQPLKVINDGKGLDVFISSTDEVNAATFFFDGRRVSFIALVIGGSYYTKKIPENKLEEIIQRATLPVVLMGGKEDQALATRLCAKFSKAKNACGLFSIMQSASLLRQAEWVISSDTGLMHIASAFHKKIISVWGNTIPEFGMGPYLPTDHNRILEIETLSCRPCSKLGYGQCPLGHFRCMQDIDYTFVSDLTSVEHHF